MSQEQQIHINPDQVSWSKDILQLGTFKTLSESAAAAEVACSVNTYYNQSSTKQVE
jgi:hypothetical protein